MMIKVDELKRFTCGIYKINFPNGKYYIGLSRDIKRRMWEHNNPSKAITPCDLAIRKYGKITEIEILELVENEEYLGSREQYWISYYKSNEKQYGYNLTIGGEQADLSGENSQTALFTNDEVLDIRKRRYLGERRKDVYKDYSNHTLGGFDRVWLGRGYPGVGAEYLIPYNPEFNRKYYSSLANSGTGCGRAKCTEEDVRDIRKKALEGMSISKIQKQYYSHLSIATIRRIVKRETYKNID